MKSAPGALGGLNLRSLAFVAPIAMFSRTSAVQQ
jgi:hypothetical protein